MLKIRLCGYGTLWLILYKTDLIGIIFIE